MRDTLTESGAQDLASRIESYWAKHGKTVKTWIVPVRMNEQQKKTIQAYCVRSSMINGCPQKVTH